MLRNGERSAPSKTDAEVDFDALLAEEDGEVDRAMRRAVQKALARHKALGESIVVWRDGKVVELSPDEI